MAAKQVLVIAVSPTQQLVSNWRKQLTNARNILALTALAAAYALRSVVWWRRWQRRHPGSPASRRTNDVGAPPHSGARRGKQ